MTSLTHRGCISVEVNTTSGRHRRHWAYKMILSSRVITATAPSARLNGYAVFALRCAESAYDTSRSWNVGDAMQWSLQHDLEQANLVFNSSHL